MSDRLAALEAALEGLVRKMAPHSGSCCDFMEDGAVIVTPESCKCGPVERAAHEAIDWYGTTWKRGSKPSGTALAVAEAPGRVAALEALDVRLDTINQRVNQGIGQGMLAATLWRDALIEVGTMLDDLINDLPLAAAEAPGRVAGEVHPAPAPTPSEPVARCVYCGNDGTGFRLSCCLTPGARDE